MYKSWCVSWINSYTLKAVFRRSVRGESIRISEKKSEAAKENRTSQMRKSNYTQSANPFVDRILFLQRTIGNQAFSRLINSGALQAKLKIGQPDVYEQEVDTVAVMKIPDISGRANLVGSHSISSVHNGSIQRQSEGKDNSPVGPEQPVDSDKCTLKWNLEGKKGWQWVRPDGASCDPGVFGLESEGEPFQYPYEYPKRPSGRDERFGPTWCPPGKRWEPPGKKNLYMGRCVPLAETSPPPPEYNDAIVPEGDEAVV